MKNNGKQKFIKATDVFVIFLTLLTIFLLSFFNVKNSSQKLIATVTVNGEEVKKFVLTEAENEIFSLETSPRVTLEIKDNKIRFINSCCPDGTCEKSGFLEKSGDTAACLPAKTVVTVSGAKSNIDAVVG